MSSPSIGPHAPVSEDAKWKILDIHRASMAAVGKSQSRYVTTLLGFMAVLWGWHFTTSEAVAIQFMGATIQPSGLWAIAPAVLTVLALALIGAMNVMGPVWERLCDASRKLGHEFFWTDLDVNKNLLDYLLFLKVWPEGAAEPTEPPTDPSRKQHFAVFSYPLVLGGSIATTLFADYPDATRAVRAYIYGCAAVQGWYSFRIWYRAVSRFLGVRKPQTEV